MTIDTNTILELAGGVTAVGGAIHTIQRIFSNYKKKKDEYRKEILKEAKKEAELMKLELESRIHALEVEFINQKESVNKDLTHLKETYNAEVKALGEKIESLKHDLSLQHQSLVALLTRLVDMK